MSQADMKGFDPFFKQEGRVISCVHDEAYPNTDFIFNLGAVAFHPCANCVERLKATILEMIFANSMKSMHSSLQVPPSHYHRLEPGSEITDDAEAYAEAHCRICGCTENDCEQCIAKTGGRCHWVPDPEMKGDLCSACLPQVAKS